MRVLALPDAPVPPHVSRQELAQVAIVFVKLGLLTSIMSVVFVLCGLWASVVFHNNLKGYQVDYI